jgi:hypothetical protein
MYAGTLPFAKIRSRMGAALMLEWRSLKMVLPLAGPRPMIPGLPEVLSSASMKAWLVIL